MPYNLVCPPLFFDELLFNKLDSIDWQSFKVTKKSGNGANKIKKKVCRVKNSLILSDFKTLRENHKRPEKNLKIIRILANFESCPIRNINSKSFTLFYGSNCTSSKCKMNQLGFFPTLKINFEFPRKKKNNGAFFSVSLPSTGSKKWSGSIYFSGSNNWQGSMTAQQLPVVSFIYVTQQWMLYGKSL